MCGTSSEVKVKLAQQLLAATVLVAGIAVPINAGVIEDAISARLAPVGSVCVEGSDCAAATAASSAGSASGPRSGEEIYNAACTACHSTGAAGAPKLGDVAAWSARLSQGMDVLYRNAINGINGMPAKGLCMDCSDEELDATVDYMVEASR